MSTSGSVSAWILDLKLGRANGASARLWTRYHNSLGQIANSALGECPRTVADEEDVVIRAFGAFLRRTAEGAYPAIVTRDDLWRLLVTMTKRYAWKQARFFRRQKRRSSTTDRTLVSLASNDPPPDVVAAVSDTLDRLLNVLEDDEFREIAMGRLHGFTNAEIATRINRSVSTVERRVAMIRTVWENSLPEN